MSVAFESAGLYLNWILIVGVTFLIDFSFYLYNYFFKGNLVGILMREKKKEGFKEFGKTIKNDSQRDYQLPLFIESLLIKKKNMSSQCDYSMKNARKSNIKDLEEIDRVDLGNPSQDKLILSNNIQISENNRNIIENNSIDNKDKTESNRAKSQNKSVPTENIVEDKKNNDKIYEYQKIQISNIDKSISASNNPLYDYDFDNSHSNIKIEKLNEQKYNFFSNRELEKSVNSSQLNIQNIDYKGRFSDRKHLSINKK